MNDQHKRSDKNKRRTFIPYRYDHDQQKLIKQKSRARRADPTRRRRPRHKDWRGREAEDEVDDLFERMGTGRDRVSLSAPATDPPAADDAPPAGIAGAPPWC